MKQLRTGEFYGETNKTIHLNGLTLTDTEYIHEKVDWHYHENAYFTLVLQGNIIEGNKKEVYTCAAGSLLFHNWQEPHYNIKPEGFTRGFHIELNSSWFKKLDLNIDRLQGSIKITNVDVKLLLYKIFKETKIEDEISALSIQSLVLQSLAEMFRKNRTETIRKPAWTKKINEILFFEHSNRLTLDYLSQELEIHPVHLSRDFSKYFNCNLGEYLRKLKIEQSLALLPVKNKSLTDIAFECGFSDQSHFTRCFKSVNGIGPKKFRKMILA
ncbi:MAG: helix-turn-helix transcriptional regulator [Bacteroidetes bacterium]|nr:helix-turn-helix transcriptional regulator [Bacteroidota bacterium]